MKFGSGPKRFFAFLALIVFAALGLRVVYVLTVTRYDTHNLYDATYYDLQARSITHGGGFFNDPFLQFSDQPRTEPAADHPPLTVLTLLPAALVEGPSASTLAMRFTMVLVGTACVALIGLLARAVAGDAAGLVAAGIAALDPNLWINDGLIMSEALAALLSAAILYYVYRVLRHGVTWPRTIGLGALAGVAILARAEFVLYVPFLVLPALWVASRSDRRSAIQAVGGSIAATAVVLAPWVAFNMARFEQPTLLSTNDGLALRAANCPSTFYGSHIGWVDVFPPCGTAINGREQSVWNAENRTLALHYVADHLDRVPLVAVTRLGRAWNVYDLDQSIFFASKEGRPEWVSYLGAITTWILVVASIYGAVVLRRRRTPIWPLIMPIVIISASIAFWAGGLLRYRTPAEPSLVVLGAIGILAVVAPRVLSSTEEASASADS